jgi:DNA polymerase-3 subunit beta
MELKCNRKELYEAVQVVGAVVASASTTTLPALQDIKMTAEGEILEISATDLEVGIRYFVKEGIEIINGGSIVVPGVKSSSILREWTEEEIKLVVEENICHLRGSNSYFKLIGGDLDSFPSVPDFPEKGKDAGGGSCVVRSDVLSEMIKKTAYAVATERVNRVLTGVLLTISGSEIKMVATDGRRFAKVDGVLEEPATAPATGIIPAKGISQLLKVMSTGGGDTIRIRLEEAYLLAKMEHAVISCRLIEGEYPNVEEVIPADNDKKLELETGKLLSAARQASLLTSDECKVIRFRFESGKTILSSEAADLGEARIELSVSYTGEPFEIGFNPDFIIDALKVVTKDRITMELKQPSTAGIIRDGQGYISLIMPINLLQE